MNIYNPRDGHTRSGLFCIAAAMLERMREEGHVAVNYVTAHMRVPRRENIVNVVSRLKE